MVFKDLKMYLLSPQLLTRPNARDTLFLYLRVSHFVVSVVMVKEEEDRHRLNYYVSKVLQEMEAKYSTIEKFSYAIVIATR